MNFEMKLNNIFYLSDGRMAFVGKIVFWHKRKLPFDATIFVNELPVNSIELTSLPFMVGKKSENDSLESTTQIDLRFIDWTKDNVVLRG